MTMRVLYSYPGTVGIAGIGTIAFHQIQGIANAGCQVAVACTSFGRLPSGMYRKKTTLTLAGVRIPHRALGGVKQAAHIHDWRVSRLLKHLKNDIDVVHGWPLGSLLTFRTARSLGITTFLERQNTHTAFAYEAVAKEMKKLGLQPPKGHSHTFDAHKLAQEEEEYNTADYLLAPSDFVRQTFLDNGFPPEKVVRHQYGCDTSRFSARRENPPDNRPLTAAFVGRCEPRKGLHYALQAWLESGAAETGRFLICGSFTPGYRELLGKWLDHPSVEVLGFIPEVAQVMRESDILLLPSIEEGSALVTYEARACGCVLVVSDATGAVCEHMVDSLVHPAGDLDCLCDHLRHLTQDRDLLPRLRAKSLEGVDRLSWSYAGKQLADLYQSCRS